MADRFDVHLPLERAYTRNVMFALEVLDAVTLERVTRGLKVKAEGLKGEPIVNHGGIFVWLRETTGALTKLVIDPRTLPYKGVEIPAAQVQQPHHVVELQPLASYPFAPGVTAIRGSLFETAPPPGVAPVPIKAATVRLRWLDEDGVTWRDDPRRILTDDWGDFAAMLRLAANQIPQLDAAGRLTLRLYAKRAGGNEKFEEFQLQEGRVTDRTSFWDQLQP
jgi:hypothetical protein